MSDFDNDFDPLTPEERDEYELDLIRFSDRELDFLGNISGKNVLYAGGTSPLWIEGLAERIGASGSLTVLDTDESGLQNARNFFDPDELPLSPEYIVGDVFALPFREDTYDLTYSSGLLHELDVRDRNISEALSEMLRVVRSGGIVVASDFVSDVPSSQVEEEKVQAEAARLATGAELFGVGSLARMRQVLANDPCGVSAEASAEFHPPFGIRHLDKLFLAQHAPDAPELRRRWDELSEAVRRGGYTRPATVLVRIFVE